MQKLLLLVLLLGAQAQARSLEQLKADYEKAYVANDKELYWSLIFKEGMGDLDKAKVTYTRSFGWSESYGRPSVKAVGLAPLRGSEEEPTIMHGVRHEPNLKIIGYIQLDYVYDDKGTDGSKFVPYGKVGDEYYVSGTKQTQLDWTGPKDKRLSYKIKVQPESAPEISRQVDVTFNASGVDMTKTRGLSNGLLGQHIDRIELTEPSAYKSLEITIRIAEDGDWKTIFDKTYTNNETLLYERSPKAE